MNSLHNRVVLITGAGRGVGAQLAEAFAAAGARVAANDITPINLDETVARVRAAGGQIRDYVADIAKKMPVQALVNQVLDDWGRLDVLVNCSGVDPQKALLDLDEWDWRRALDVNLTGPFLLMQSVGRVMRESGGGVILNVLAPDGGASLQTSMAALATLTVAAAREFSAYNIRVHALALRPLGLPGEQRSPYLDLPQTALALCNPEETAKAESSILFTIL